MANYTSGAARRLSRSMSAEARDLSGYVGTLWRHTRKGVARGEPADRIFAVARLAVDQGVEYLLAWKVDELPNGRLDHPAFKRTLSRDDKRLFIQRGRNGSTPTAMFRPDSLYRRA